LPKGEWYNLYNDEILAGEKEYVSQVPFHEIPVFVKSSSVLPMQSTVQSTREKPSDTLYVHVFCGNEMNSYTFYEDDGETMAYTGGAYRKRNIIFNPTEKQIRFGKTSGSFTAAFTHIECVLHGFPAALSSFTINGKAVPVLHETHQLLNGLRYLEDLYDKNYMAQLKALQVPPNVKIIIFEDAAEEINIQWE